MNQRPRHLQFGERSERLAREFLSARGYRIVEVNVRFPVGELDIVAWEGSVLCFVEVRSTSSMQWGGPFASIGWDKQRRLIQAARWYLARLKRTPAQTRFDVVAVLWKDGAPPQVELLKGAFDATAW